MAMSGKWRRTPPAFSSLFQAQQALANALKDSEWPPILAVVAEMDPGDIRDSGRDFIKLWTSAGHRGEYRVLQGHNII